MKLQNIQIFLLRLALGALFLHLGMGKLNEGWIRSSSSLMEDLQNFQKTATGLHLRYLAEFAIPYAGAWSKFIALGEAALGISLLSGLLVRFSSALGIIMVLNLNAGAGNLFTWNFFWSPWAAMILSGLLAMMLSGAGRWFGIDQFLSKSKPRSIFW